MIQKCEDLFMNFVYSEVMHVILWLKQSGSI